MQKARCHSLRCSNRLQAYGFRVYFTPLFEVLFTFPSQYWFAIGLSGVFSLTGWSPLIRPEFLVFRVTQDSTRLQLRFEYKAVTFFGQTFQSVLLLCFLPYRSPTTPIMPKHNRFGLVRVRSPLLTESLLFSFPPGTQMFQFPGLAWYNTISLLMGYPIRKSTDQRLFAPPRSFSQLITSFFALQSLGILRMPLFVLYALVLIFSLKSKIVFRYVSSLLYLFPNTSR